MHMSHTIQHTRENLLAAPLEAKLDTPASSAAAAAQLPEQMPTYTRHLAAGWGWSTRPLLPCCPKPVLGSSPVTSFRRHQLLSCAAHAAAGGSTRGVQVVLKLQKRIPFGQQLAVLSSDKDWSIDHAAKLDWAEGKPLTPACAVARSTGCIYGFARCNLDPHSCPR